MFDHFRTFFVGAFHLHVVSYVAPLCIKLRCVTVPAKLALCLRIHRHDPLFASIIVLGIVATFKSYPSVGDVAVFHAMLSMYPEIYPRAFAFFPRTSS